MNADSPPTNTRSPGSGDTAKEMALMALCSLQSQFQSYFSRAQEYDVQTAIDLLRQPSEPHTCETQPYCAPCDALAKQPDEPVADLTDGEAAAVFMESGIPKLIVDGVKIGPQHWFDYARAIAAYVRQSPTKDQKHE